MHSDFPAPLDIGMHMANGVGSYCGIRVVGFSGTITRASKTTQRAFRPARQSGARWTVKLIISIFCSQKAFTKRLIDPPFVRKQEHTGNGAICALGPTLASFECRS